MTENFLIEDVLQQKTYFLPTQLNDCDGVCVIYICQCDSSDVCKDDSMRHLTLSDLFFFSKEWRYVL